MKAKVKQYLYHVFIDGLSGMALGLFCTLIIGTILDQIGQLIGGTVGTYIIAVAGVAKSLMGAGIGVGVAVKYKSAPLVSLSAATAGMVGAFATKILAGTVQAGTVMTYAGPGEPLGAFVAALVAIEVSRLVAGKTKLDILITPAVMITSGSVVGLLLGPSISELMTGLGNLINWGTEQQPILMGIVVSVIMGLCLTLPISSAALGLILGLDGIAAGAAVVGCSAQMIGFAVASFRENGCRWLVCTGYRHVDAANAEYRAQAHHLASSHDCQRYFGADFRQGAGDDLHCFGRGYGHFGLGWSDYEL